MLKTNIQQDNSEFVKKVFDIVRRIPRGSVMTYKEIARLTGKPKAYRAVGNALNKNYNPDIPCHRVIKSNGESGGYNRGAAAKIKMLRREGIL